jgi:membrane-associated phospholipid phosphatase
LARPRSGDIIGPPLWEAARLTAAGRVLGSRTVTLASALQHEASALLWGSGATGFGLTIAVTWWIANRPPAGAGREGLRRTGPSRVRGGLPAIVAVTVGLGLAFAIGWGFGLLTKSAPFEAFDASAARWVAARRPTAMNHAVSILTAMGGYAVTTVAAAALGVLVSWWERRFAPLFLAMAGVAGAYVLRRSLGVLVGSSHPPSRLAVGTPAVYPSGGTIRVLVVLALAAWLVSRHRPARTPAWWATAAALTYLEGLSRIWLGRHWVMDVVGGAVIGGIWSAALIAAGRTLDGHMIRRSQEKTPRPRQRRIGTGRATGPAGPPGAGA